MALIRKPCHIGNFRDRDFTFGQQFFGEVQAQIYEVAVWRHAECLGESYDEMIG